MHWLKNNCLVLFNLNESWFSTAVKCTRGSCSWLYIDDPSKHFKNAKSLLINCVQRTWCNWTWSSLTLFQHNIHSFIHESMIVFSVLKQSTGDVTDAGKLKFAALHEPLYPFPPHRAGSSTACWRREPLRTAAGTTGRERSEAWAAQVEVEEPEQSHTS